MTNYDMIGLPVIMTRTLSKTCFCRQPNVESNNFRGHVTIQRSAFGSSDSTSKRQTCDNSCLLTFEDRRVSFIMPYKSMLFGDDGHPHQAACVAVAAVFSGLVSKEKFQPGKELLPCVGRRDGI